MRSFRLVAILCSSLLLSACAGVSTGGADAQGRKFQFAVIGDTGYSKRSEQEFEHVLAAMNRQPLTFVVHVGDFEADPRPYARNPDRISMPCTDESFARARESFQRSAHPFVLTPGDNDWADCHLLKARSVDPLERLARLREMFFPEGRTLGQRTMPVVSQAKEQGFDRFRENLTWTMNEVVFATLHTVGSNDNLGRGAETDAEQAERKTANIAWTKRAFAAARAPEVRGLVLFTQANVAFESHWTDSLKARYVRSAGGRMPKDAEGTAYDALVDARGERADVEYVRVLHLAASTLESRVEAALEQLLAEGTRLDYAAVKALAAPEERLLPDVHIPSPDPASYNSLLASGGDA